MERAEIGDIWEYDGFGPDGQMFFNFLIVDVLGRTSKYTDCRALYLEYGEIRLISINYDGDSWGNKSTWRKVA